MIEPSIKFRPNYTEVRIIKNGTHYSIYVGRHFIGTDDSEERGFEKFSAEASFHCSYNHLWSEEIRMIAEEACKSKGRVDLSMGGLTSEEKIQIRLSLKSRGLEIMLID